MNLAVTYLEMSMTITCFFIIQKWNTDLQTSAQDYANLCNYTHSGQSGKGENIYYTTGKIIIVTVKLICRQKKGLWKQLDAELDSTSNSTLRVDVTNNTENITHVHVPGADDFHVFENNKRAWGKFKAVVLAPFHSHKFCAGAVALTLIPACVLWYCSRSSDPNKKQ